MKDFEYFCYLLICRQEVNHLHKRMLYRYNAKLDEINNKTQHIIAIKKIEMSKKERELYRNVANHMRKTAVSTYSPLRRKLNIRVKYDTNNACECIYYNDTCYEYATIKKIASDYEFDEIVLRDDKKLKNPYKKCLSYDRK